MHHNFFNSSKTPQKNSDCTSDSPNKPHMYDNVTSLQDPNIPNLCTVIFLANFKSRKDHQL